MSADDQMELPIDAPPVGDPGGSWLSATGPEALAASARAVELARSRAAGRAAGRMLVVQTLIGRALVALRSEALPIARRAIVEAAAIYGLSLAGHPPDPEPLPLDTGARQLGDLLTDLADALPSMAPDEEAPPLDAEALYRVASRLLAPPAGAAQVEFENHAYTLWRLADLVEERRGGRAALPETRRAVEAWRAVAADDVAGQPLAEALLDLAVRSEHDPQAAADAADEAVGLMRAAYVDDPDESRFDLARALFVASVYHGALGRRPVALNTIEEAVAVLRTAPPDSLRGARPLLAHCLHNLGLWTQPVRPRAAEPALREAVGLYRALDAEDPGSFADDIATSLASLASLLAVHRHTDEAARLNDEAIERLRALADAGVEHMDAALADALIISGSLAETVGDPAAAAALWDEGIERLWPAFEAAPDDKGYTTALLLACRLRLAEREPALHRDLRPLVERFNRLQWPEGPGLIRTGRWTLEGRRPAG